MSALLASIPSPSVGRLSIGPLGVSAYGLMIAIGVIAGTALASRRLERAGAGTSEDMQSVALWSVLGGVIGARLYHVATAWELFADDYARIPMIWRGGLGIPGGLLVGTLAGILAVRRRGLWLPAVLTAAAPGIPLAQAIGRLGNWWNQELFGRPTTLPWGLEISNDKIPHGFEAGTLFYPTFLYESLWNIGLCLVLLAIDRYRPMRPGRLFGVYVVGYFLGRFWIEGIRIDAAHTFGGLRLNQWVAAAAVAGSLVIAVIAAIRRRRSKPSETGDRRSQDVDPDLVGSTPSADHTPP
ncbi:prolipoprotein diacylglyceryl transferase [Ilumatobacter nonamiensis]|uniref:prolipoprotein diacylglyceryl transferase n=1 Tax=Ilumatobacter nonamiensis TaxID=467093 RepID=UPI000345EC9B|nr:prolipoprotein diacylglyceryl transferase [Ilumatobacter nonamiensis]